MLKHFYKSPNGYFRLGTIPGGYPPGTTPRHIEERFGDPDQRALERREAEEDKADEERKLRRLRKGRSDQKRQSTFTLVKTTPTTTKGNYDQTQIQIPEAG